MIRYHVDENGPERDPYGKWYKYSDVEDLVFGLWSCSAISIGKLAEILDIDLYEARRRIKEKGLVQHEQGH